MSGGEDSAGARLDRAIASMNRGYALLGTGSTATIPGAIEAYGDAIALLEPLADAAHPSIVNSLGAAWMNHGLACHREETPGGIAQSVRSLERAVEVLGRLPLDEARWFRRNRAAAAMNLANALLDSTRPSRLREARAAARDAVEHAAPLERTDPESAEVSLKARRAWCDALGQLLVVPAEAGTTPEILAAEASDVVDDGLDLARAWDRGGAPGVRALSLRLFYFGAQLYRIHQPHFLAEFLREQESVIGRPDYLAICLETIGLALHGHAGGPIVGHDPVDANRHLRTARDLEALRAQLTAAS